MAASQRPVRRAAQRGAEADTSAAGVAAARAVRHPLVFTGAGLSVAAGMSAFSTPGGLYDRARRRYALPDGIRLFTHSFYLRRRADALAFLAEVWDEARLARPTPAHALLGRLAAAGRLAAHVTLNIDGLVRQAGGEAVELHGCVLEAVCPACRSVSLVSPSLAAAWRARADAGTACVACAAPLRPRVMLYDDAEAALVTPDEDFQRCVLAPAAAADAVFWIGISFTQSASVELFRSVRRALARAGRGEAAHFVVNPDADAAFNLLSALSGCEQLTLHAVQMRAEEFLTSAFELSDDAAGQASACEPSREAEGALPARAAAD